MNDSGPFLYGLSDVSPIIPGFKCRKVTAADLPALDELSKPAGYDIGMDNLELYFKTSQGSWYMVETDDGQAVACIVTNLLPSGVYYGFNLVVRQDVMDRRLTTLLPIPQRMLSNASSDSLKRFSSRITVIRDKYCAYSATLKSSDLERLKNTAANYESGRIVPFDKKYSAKLFAYDSAVLGFSRTEFMKAYTEDLVNSKTLIALDAADQVVGYTILRKYPASWTIQPLYANSESIANELYRQAACCLHEGDEIFSIFLAKSNITMRFMHELGAAFCYTELRWMQKDCVELCENLIDFTRVHSVHEYYPA